MKVKLMRIDSRLVHGQIANNWVNFLGVNTIICASDAAANDELRKTLLLQVGSAPTKTHVLTVAKAARVFNNPKYDTMDSIFIVETPADVVRLLDEGVKFDEVNVGGMTFKQGQTQISKAVSVFPEDVEAFKELDRRGVKMYLQQIPGSERSDLMPALQAKGLL